MIYRHANNLSYEDFASGRALCHAPGATNFPARLAIELAGRCIGYTRAKQGLTLYDPLCGAGYLLTVAALWHAGKIARVRGTDADGAAVAVARKNCALLAPGGLSDRAQELREMGERFGRDSYAEAARSAECLAGMLPAAGIACEVFPADAFHLPDDGFRADIVLTDLPYGQMKAWMTGGEEGFLAAMHKALVPEGILCIVSGKSQQCAGEGYQRLERQRIGKRQFEIYRRIG